MFDLHNNGDVTELTLGGAEVTDADARAVRKIKYKKQKLTKNLLQQ